MTLLTREIWSWRLAASYSKCRQTTFNRKQELITTYSDYNASYNVTNYALYFCSVAYKEAETDEYILFSGLTSTFCVPVYVIVNIAVILGEFQTNRESIRS